MIAIIKKLLLLNLIFFFAGNSLFSQTATLPLGDGSAVNPYQISSLENLFWIAVDNTRWDFHYIQTANINASATSSWNSGAGWTPIGNSLVKFTGTYNGQGFTISDLSINRPTSNEIGLFGDIGLASGYRATIQKLSLVNASVVGKDQVGLIAGRTNRDVDFINCHVSGSVHGNRNVGGMVGDVNHTIILYCSSSATVGINNQEDVRYHGGLIGLINGSSSAVKQCFATGSVTGASHIGGLVGAQGYNTTIENCFATGNVYPTVSLQTSPMIGGLAGEVFQATLKNSYSTGTVDITNLTGQYGGLVGKKDTGGPFADVDNFWNTETSGLTSSELGIGKTNTQMQAQSTFNNWDFNSGTGIWEMSSTIAADGYPHLKWENIVTPAANPGQTGGVYEISSLDDLRWIAESSARWGYSYRQTANINAASSSTWNSGAGWTPIGNDVVKFLGNYDGQGYTIDGLYINRPNTNNVGLFGHIGYAGLGVTIKNLNLTNITVIGGRGSGSLAGRVTGDKTNLIENCSAVGGTVVGDGATGGLVGSHNSYAENPGNRDHHPVLSKSFANIDVSWSGKAGSGADKFGGLTGCNQKGQIQHCFARGSVTVNNDPAVSVTNSDGSVPSRIGGLSGCILIRGYIINSYSTGQVASSGTVNKAGGLVGNGGTGGSDGDTEKSFWDTQTSGQETSSPTSGTTGKTTSEMKIQNTYTDWEFINTWTIYSGYNDGYPYLQWQIFLWVGETDTSWASAGNWNAAKIPGATGNSVFIKGGSTYYPVISDEQTINNLEIESAAFLTVGSGGDLLTNGTLKNSGTLTINANGRLTSEGTLVNSAGAGGFIVESDATTGSGSVILNNNDVVATVRRYVSGKEWHIISPPVSGQPIGTFLTNTNSGISKNADGEYAMTHYNESRYASAGGWDSYYTELTPGDLLPGEGYLAGRSAAGILEFTGTLAGADNVNVEITRVTNGWNAIGNPFASAIGVTPEANTSETFLVLNSEVIDSNYGAIYIYDSKHENGSYRIINNVPVGKPELYQNYLQPGQGFIVKSKEGGGSISFTSGMRGHVTEATAPFFTKSTTGAWSLLRLQVAYEQKMATTIIAFNGNMSRGLDPTYDAGQYGADPEFKLYTRLAEDDEGVNFAIQALPDYGFEDMVIPLGIDFAGGGEVTFAAPEMNLPAGASAMLEDRLLGVYTDLAQENYTVTLNENSSGTGRFFIATTILITSADEFSPVVALKKLNIYAHEREIYIVGEVKPESYAELYDMSGRKVKTVSLANPERNSFRIDDLNTGIYLIRITGQDGPATARVFIN